jgi:hypothetical protein
MSDKKPGGPSDAPKPPLPPNYGPEYGAGQASEIQRQVREGINRSLPPNVEPTHWERMQKKNGGQ